MRKFLTTISSLTGLIWDVLVLYTPVHYLYKVRQPGVALLVHPRDIAGIYQSFPLFSVLPEKLTRWLGCKFGAITLSHVEAPHDVQGQPIRAELLSLVMDPVSIQSNQTILPRKLKQLGQLAQRKKLHLVALGSSLPTITNHGRILDIDPTTSNVTTGDVCTAWCIQATLAKIAASRHPTKSGFTVGILGATGSIGTLATHMINKLRVRQAWVFDLILIDKDQQRVNSLAKDVDSRVLATNDIPALKCCDYIIVATDPSYAVLKPEHIKSGSVVIDSSQPRATTKALREKAYVVDVLTRVPGLNANFNFGIRSSDRTITSSPLAEVILLAYVGHTDNFAVGPAGKSSPDDVVNMFSTYLQIADAKGLVIEPVTNISFGEEMSHAAQECMMKPTTLPTETAA